MCVCVCIQEMVAVGDGCVCIQEVVAVGDGCVCE